jgi:CheY-like chemotaxis protein
MKPVPRIVVIDDNRAWLEVLAEYLRDKGFDVLTATDAARGLPLLEGKEVSLVVCDYHMPGMDGLQLIRHLQQQQRQAAILMLSDDREPSLRARALEAGAQAFLEKSVAPGQLLRKVKQLVDAALADASQTMQLWQRLLPGPRRGNPRRGNGRTAAHSPRSEGHNS